MEHKDSVVMTAFQTACLAIIVLIAKFIGDLLYDSISEESFSMQLRMFLISVSILNFFEIINNWASIKKYFELYRTPLFLIDVMTLGVFFWQVYILSKFGSTLQGELKIVNDELEHKMMLVTMTSYGTIFLLYICWNICILYKIKDQEKEKIIQSAFVHGIQACLIFKVVLPAIEYVPTFFSEICVLTFILYVLIHNQGLDIFETIIKATPKNPISKQRNRLRVRKRQERKR